MVRCTCVYFGSLTISCFAVIFGNFNLICRIGDRGFCGELERENLWSEIVSCLCGLRGPCPNACTASWLNIFRQVSQFGCIFHLGYCQIKLAYLGGGGRAIFRCERLDSAASALSPIHLMRWDIFTTHI